MMKKTEKNEMAAYLFHQGTNFEAYRYLGFHILPYGDGKMKNAVFRTWAPNAEKVCLVGDFNSWKDDLQMEKVTDSGVYEIRLPDGKVKNGDLYKFRITTSEGRILDKADPYAFYSEKPPGTASRIFISDGFHWTDDGYLSNRSASVSPPNYRAPINIYEMHLASWKRDKDGEYLSYGEIAAELIPYIKQMGYTHVELMPVMEHPFDGSWGYQITGYYAPTSRFGDPDKFKSFVNSLHGAGIGVILDWVPAHFPKDAHGLCEFDGKPLYEFQGWDRMEHAGWGTRKFDIARNEVECFLISNASYWIEEFHVDGLRVDAVAAMLYLDYDKKPGEWIPNIYGENKSLEAIAFFKKLNGHIAGKYPDVMMIAEESTAYASVTKPVSDGGLGFNFKWNMGWMNDTLSYAETDFDYRHSSHGKTNFSLMYAFSENYMLPISHDEVVHGKKTLLDRMPGDYWRKFAGSRLFLSYMICHPGKKLTFMGIEIGQFAEWNYKESVEWFLLDYDMHKKHQLFMRDLNEFYLSHSQLWYDDHSWDGFRWLRPDDNANSVSSFLRIDRSLGENRELTVVINFNYMSINDFIIDVPHSGKYREVFSSDKVVYGGSGKTNDGVLESYKGIYGNDLLNITLPPLGVCIFESVSTDDIQIDDSKPDTLKKEKVPRKKSTSATDCEKKTVSHKNATAKKTAATKSSKTSAAGRVKNIKKTDK